MLPSELSREEWAAFYAEVARDLNVDCPGETWIGSEIADADRIVDFSNYYFSRTDLPPLLKSELAQAVWESFEWAWVDNMTEKRTPTAAECLAVERVVLNAQQYEDFCFYLATIVIFGNKTHPCPDQQWLFDLPGFDLDNVLSLAGQRIVSLVKDK